jgi:hypothetical protein
VLFVVELLDPISATVVDRGMTVRLVGVSGAPVVNASGRFVWLARPGSTEWPTAVEVTPAGANFAAEVASVPPPEKPEAPTAEERLARLVLRPTSAYPFEGVTALRGSLVESKDVPTPVVGARVQLAWCDRDGEEWFPPFPEMSDGSADGVRITPSEVETDAHGEFGVFVRTHKATGVTPDVCKGWLRVRVQVTRPAKTPLRRVTRPDFPFMRHDNERNACDYASRVPEGRVVPTAVQLRWSELDPAN